MELTLSRSLLIVLALLAGAWLALALRSAMFESEGAAAVDRAEERRLSADEVERARNSLRRARRFSTDGGPLLSEGLLLYRAGRPAEAAAVAERLVALEPDNFDGWYLLYAASQGRNQDRATSAFFTATQLNPHILRTVR